MSTTRVYSSSEMLSIVGCTRKTLRVLERHNLIRPARRTGHRRYTRENVRRLWLLLTLRDLGLTIPQVAAIVDAPDRAATGGGAATELGDTIDRVITKIDSKTRDLQVAREALVTSRKTMTACSTCEREVSACLECAKNGRLDNVSAVLLAKLGNLDRDLPADEA